MLPLQLDGFPVEIAELNRLQPVWPFRCHFPGQLGLYFGAFLCPYVAGGPGLTQHLIKLRVPPVLAFGDRGCWQSWYSRTRDS
jgi:hypothetical protein